MARPSPARVGGAGFDPELAALLTVDVDLGPLERGLNEGRRQARTALDDMAGSATRFSRSSRFAFQNAAFQVQDFVVQVGAGQGAMRAFALQAPQLLGAFGPVGAVLGTVAAIVGAMGVAFLSSGRDAANAADDVDTLDEALKRLSSSSEDVFEVSTKLAEQFADATDQAREFIRAVADIEVDKLAEQQRAAQEEFASTITQFKAADIAGVLEGLGDEQITEILRLADAFANLRIGADEFQRELQPFIDAAGPAAAAVLREMGNAAVLAGASVLDLGKQLRDAQQRQAELARLAGKGVSFGVEEFGPPEPSAGAGRGAIDRAASEAARRLENLRDKLRDLRAEVEAARAGPFGDLGDQIADLGDVARVLDLTPEEIAQQPAEVRELVQAYIELGRTLRELEEQNKATVDAEQQRIKQLQEEHDALAGSFEDQRREEERAAEQAERQRTSRIEAGGRLPNDIDAANIAAAELATTLTELDGLSFASLGEAFASIGQQLAQMVLQALIFRAIMGGIGGGAGLFGGLFGGGPVPTAQHGAVFRRGQMALMTGAISGAALLEGAGDEAAVPLTRTRSGDLGVRVEGGGGRQGDTYNLVAQRIDPGTVSWLLNTARQQVPNTVVNARARGQVRDKAPF